MLGKALRKFDHWFSIAVLVVILAGTVAAGVFGGLKVAGIVGLLLFLFLDGYECLCTVATRREAEMIDEELDAKEKGRFYEKSKDNPTIR